MKLRLRTKIMTWWLYWRHDWHLFRDKYSYKLYLWFMRMMGNVYSWRVANGYEAPPVTQSYDWRAPR